MNLAGRIFGFLTWLMVAIGILSIPAAFMTVAESIGGSSDSDGTGLLVPWILFAIAAIFAGIVRLIRNP
jgi:uncharacterized membrane protein HdeD (DUF308 family)